VRLIEERAFWLAWSQIPGIGPILQRRLQQHFGTLSLAWEANAKALGQVEGFGRQIIDTVVRERSRFAPEMFLKEHSVKNPCFWTPADREYPRLLLEIPSPPPVLYYRGIVQVEENLGITPTVAIVGTRDPSDYGKFSTRHFSIALAKQGFTIVSGMAEGIDTEAHRACLETGGRTIAVLGTGVDIIYPPRNQKLYEQILQQGLVLSEYPSGTKPNRAHFPSRNRIIAGLSRAVLVMEAPSRSGALITARLANEFCRDVYTLPARWNDYKSTGCLGLLSKGAQLIINEGLLVEMLSGMPPVDTGSIADLPLFSQQVTSENRQPLPKLEPQFHKILEAIASEPTALDLIVQQTGFSAAEVLSSLLQLELMGLVSQLPGMRYQRCSA
jgi:DNA processing protein